MPTPLKEDISDAPDQIRELAVELEGAIDSGTSEDIRGVANRLHDVCELLFAATKAS